MRSGNLSVEVVIVHGCLKTARKHAISAQLRNLKLLVSFFLILVQYAHRNNENRLEYRGELVKFRFNLFG